MNKKIFFICVPIFLLSSLIIFFVALQHPRIANNQTCDQSATTTPCNELHTIANGMPTSTVMSATTTTPDRIFSFGPLIHTYEDRGTGFLIKYPEELSLSFPDCVSLNDKDGIRNIGIKICKQGVGIALNEKMNAKKLEDFTTDYEVAPSSTEQYLLSRNVSIKNSEEVITDSGTKGLKQNYETWSVMKNTGEKVDMYSGLRYVFFKPKSGTYFIYIFTQGTIEPFENTLIKSISYK